MLWLEHPTKYQSVPSSRMLGCYGEEDKCKKGAIFAKKRQQGGKKGQKEGQKERKHMNSIVLSGRIENCMEKHYSVFARLFPTGRI